MNARKIIVIGVSLLSVALICCAFVQRHQLNELKARQQQLRQEEAAPQAATTSFRDDKPRDMEPATVPPQVSPELLKLRAQVSQLIHRRDELAPLATENEQIKAQLAGRATNSSPGAGWVRKSQAKFVGYDSPQNTLQTFLWALHHKNYPTLLHTMVPELVESLQRAEGTPGFSRGKIFESSEAIIGLGIINLVKVNPDGSPEGIPTNSGDGKTLEGASALQAQVQIAPDVPLQLIIFRRVAGEWKMEWTDMMQFRR
jgi:hypothetical protein